MIMVPAASRGAGVGGASPVSVLRAAARISFSIVGVSVPPQQGQAIEPSAAEAGSQAKLPFPLRVVMACSSSVHSDDLSILVLCHAAGEGLHGAGLPAVENLEHPAVSRGASYFQLSAISVAQCARNVGQVAGLAGSLGKIWYRPGLPVFLRFVGLRSETVAQITSVELRLKASSRD
jgi:hypothetical protein